MQLKKGNSPYTVRSSGGLGWLMTDLSFRCPLHSYFPAWLAEAELMERVALFESKDTTLSGWISCPFLYHVYVHESELPFIPQRNFALSAGNTSDQGVISSKDGTGISREREAHQSLFISSEITWLHLILPYSIKPEKGISKSIIIAFAYINQACIKEDNILGVMIT